VIGESGPLFARVRMRLISIWSTWCYRGS